MADHPLSSLTVVEVSRDLPAAYAGRQFAAWGAEVLVVEPPGGSPLRLRGPFARGRDGNALSLLWEYVAGGKRSVGAPEGIAALLDGADVLLIDTPPPELDALGLPALDEIAARWPHLVVVHASPFGLDGPYADYSGGDLVVQAVSGFMSYNGVADREPLKAPANIVAYACGVSAFVGAVAALHERVGSGFGQVVEVSGLDAVASMTPYLRTEYSGLPFARTGGPGGGTTMFECLEGYLSVLPNAPRVWDDMLVALEVDPRDVPDALNTDAGRRDVVIARAFIGAQLRRFTAEDAFHRLSAVKAVCGVYRSVPEVMTNPQVIAREVLGELEHPNLGTVTVPGAPGRFERSQLRPPARAPALWSSAAPPSTRPANAGALGQAGGPPLSGVKVVDLTHAWIGTYATMLLADLGADVLKVESLRHPDVWRVVDTQERPRARNSAAHPLNISSLFNAVNRGKRSLVLELDQARGRELCLELVKDADLVVENFTPRVMSNLGLDYAALRAVNPRLVMVSYSGFGATGPFRDYRANGATTETHCGWDALFGYRDSPPMMMGAMQADAITGLQMAASALVALANAKRTGEGEWIDGSMLDAAVGYIGEEVMLASLTDAASPPRGNRSLDVVPHNVFPTAGDDEWLAIAVEDDAVWHRLVGFVGDDRLSDERFGTLPGRRAHEDEIEQILAEWTRSYHARHLMQRLQEAGVSAGAVQRSDQVLADLHLAERGWFQVHNHPDLGAHRYNGFPWRFSRTPAHAPFGPPRLGEHSREALATRLGLTDDEIDALVEAGVTGALLERAPVSSRAAPGA